MTDELKSCPFCGGTAKHTPDGETNHIIECNKCKAATYWKDTKLEALTCWNERDHEQNVKDLMKSIQDIQPEIERRVNGFIREFQRVLNAMIDCYIEKKEKTDAEKTKAV